MPVDWRMGLTVAPPKMNALEAFQQGREERRAKDSRNALTKIFQQGQGGFEPRGPNGEAIPGYAYGAPGGGIGGQNAVDRANMGNESDAWATLAQNDPEAAFKLRGQMQQQQGQQQDRHLKQMEMTGRLLNHAKDEQSYQQALGVARRMGLDVSGAPPEYGDGSWVQQQKIVLQALGSDGEKISGIARELVDAGYQPGTPEFSEAMRSVISNKYASEYVDESGNTRRRSTLNLGASRGPQPGMVEDGYRFKGGNPADPSAWEPISQGGPAAVPHTPFAEAFQDYPARP